MNKVLESKLFSLLSEPSQVATTEEMQNAYGQFIKQIEAASSSEDKPTLFRTLNSSRIEIAHLQNVFQYEQEKKCLERCVLQKSNSIP